MDFANKARLSGGVFWCCYGLLIVLLTLSTFWFHREGQQPSLTIWLIRLLPVIMFLPGLLRNQLRAYVWLCFVLLLYFISAVVEAMSPSGTVMDYGLLATIVILFNAAMFYVRWEARRQKMNAGGSDE